MLKATAIVVLIATAGVGMALFQRLPSIAAGGLLHPARHASLPKPPETCHDRIFDGVGVTLAGWSCAAKGARRGTIVYLHGIADNRGSSVGAIRRYVAGGFDVIAYDSRAHGLSTGEICTYGYLEKADLRRVLDTLGPGPVFLIGTSLGAAVALQAAAEEPRIASVIAAEVFADLETVARERAPFFLGENTIREAFAIAEERGRFSIAAVSPEAAASKVRVPVLLLHGDKDTETPPAHSQRVFAALPGRKRLLIVAGAGHNQSLHHAQTWSEIDRWIDDVLVRSES